MDKNLEERLQEHTKEAIWIQKKKRFSTVWIVPIVALIIGAILILEAMNNRGVEVEISFKSAAGIVAKKSIIKYKDIEVGKVTSVDFSQDLKSVIVKAEIKKSLKDYLSENTKFWIVHARLSADSIEGLDTILSGSYISMYPAKGEKSKRFFKGLEEPPVVVDLSGGIRLTLEAEDRGSLQIGSPVYYKKLKAGSVLGYKLSSDTKKVYIDIFVKEPFAKLINQRTKFWESSGIKANITGDGVEIQTESLTAILSGGISFDNFSASGSELLNKSSSKKIESGSHFILYKDKSSAKKIKYTKELYFWVYFQGSVRGLKEGSPVEFRGVKIGEVVNFFLVGDKAKAEFKIPILIKVEPERFFIEGNREFDIDVLKRLLSKGLRAQLQTMNLLTGELFVNLDFYEKAGEVELKKENGLYVLPTVPATLETLKSDIKSLLDNLAKIPFEKIGKNLNETIELVNGKLIPELSELTNSTNSLMREGNVTIADINKKTIPKINSLIDEFEVSLKKIKDNYLDRSSQFNSRVIRLLNETTRAIKSIKSLADYLQRHPDSLIKGK